MAEPGLGFGVGISLTDGAVPTLSRMRARIVGGRGLGMVVDTEVREEGAGKWDGMLVADILGDIGF